MLIKFKLTLPTMRAGINPLMAHSLDEKLETSKNNEDNVSKTVEMCNKSCYDYSDANCFFSCPRQAIIHTVLYLFPKSFDDVLLASKLASVSMLGSLKWSFADSNTYWVIKPFNNVLQEGNYADFICWLQAYTNSLCVLYMIMFSTGTKRIWLLTITIWLTSMGRWTIWNYGALNQQKYLMTLESNSSQSFSQMSLWAHQAGPTLHTQQFSLHSHRVTSKGWILVCHYHLFAFTWTCLCAFHWQHENTLRIEEWWLKIEEREKLLNCFVLYRNFTLLLVLRNIRPRGWS